MTFFSNQSRYQCIPPTIVNCFLKINQMLSLPSHPVSLFNPHFPRRNFLVQHPFFMLLPQPKNFLITSLCTVPLSCASPTHSQNFLTAALCVALLSCASPTKQLFYFISLIFVQHHFLVLLPHMAKNF